MTASERNQGQHEPLASKQKVEPDQEAEMARKDAQDGEALDDSDDNVPLAISKQHQSAGRAAANGVASNSDDDRPLAARSSTAAVSKVMTRKLESVEKQVVKVKKVAVKVESGVNKRSLDENTAGTNLNSAKKLKSTELGTVQAADKARDGQDADEDDADDDLPLVHRKNVQAGRQSVGAGVKRPMNGKNSTLHSSPLKKMKPSIPAKVKDEVSEVKEAPTAEVDTCKARGQSSKGKDEAETDDDDDDDVPLSQRMSVKKTVSVKKTTMGSGMKLASKKVLEARKTKTRQVQKVVKTKELVVDKRAPGGGAEIKWNTLHHNGVVFPPPYQQHGVKVLYDGKPVDLTEKQEEVRAKP